MVSYASFDVAVVGGSLRVGRWDGGSEPGRSAGSEVILAVHGITGNHLHFGALAERLPAGSTLIAPDLRGRGRSVEVAGPFSPMAHVDDVMAVLDVVGADRVDIIGHSMGAFVAVACAWRHPHRVRNLILVDGGVPLELGPLAELPIEELLTGLLGPALQRLGQTFESVDAYLDYWRGHPAFADAWSTYAERAMAYDLRGSPPTLRPAVRREAVIADARSELDSEVHEVSAALTGLTVPTVLVRAERGIMNQTPPLYPDDVVARWLDAAPMLRSTTVLGANHYTILLSDCGADAVWQAFRAVRR